MKDWKIKTFEGAVLLVMVAVAGRLAWNLLQPLVPVLVVLVGLALVYGIILRGRR